MKFRNFYVFNLLILSPEVFQQFYIYRWDISSHHYLLIWFFWVSSSNKQLIFLHFSIISCKLLIGRADNIYYIWITIISNSPKHLWFWININYFRQISSKAVNVFKIAFKTLLSILDQIAFFLWEYVIFWEVGNYFFHYFLYIQRMPWTPYNWLEISHPEFEELL